MEAFLEAGLDGFVMDAPAMYIGIGDDGGRFYDELSSYVHSYSDPPRLILGEVYDKDPTWLPRWMGLNAGLTEFQTFKGGAPEGDTYNDGEIFPLYPAIDENDPSKIEDEGAFRGIDAQMYVLRES